MTNSERRVQRVRKALDPPGEARDDMLDHQRDRRAHGLRLGPADRRGGLGRAALALADAPRHELRQARGAGRHPVAVPGRGEHRARRSCTRGCGPSRSRASRRRSRPSSTGRPTRRSTPSTRSGSPPAAGSSRTTPARRRTATARRCTAASRSTSRPRTPSACCSRRARSCASRRAAAPSRRPVHIDPSLRPGLAFMTFHFPDQVDTNLLTIDVTDPKSGTAEFKACAIRVDKLARARADGQRARRGAGEHPGRLMDIHLLDAAPTVAERAAVDARARPAARRLGRRRARLGPAGPLAARRRARGARAAAPAAAGAAAPCRSTSAGSARARSTTSRERLTVPPADVYGVATFYALLRVEPRPPRVIHVCEDLACRCNGSQELIAQLEEHFGRRGRAQRRRLGDLAPQPVPRPVRPRARGAADGRRRAPRGARARAGRRRRRARGARRAARWPAPIR